jgi:formylglycine-generating enzyme required for sulfatase activity
MPGDLEKSCILLACVLACSCRMIPGSATSPARWVEPRTGLLFIAVEPGRFVMGSPPDEIGREAQEIQHPVTLTHRFWLGAFEVTQRQWTLVMGDNPSWFARDDDTRPVENVTWFHIEEFLQRLTKLAPENVFRLPTEAEWEYACRAGTTAPYSAGAALSSSNANIASSPEAAERGQTMRVGSFSPNPWGFYDMHGNVWEWTADEHCPYGSDPVIDPRPSCGGPLKVIRGGSWYFGADSARCALRYTHRPQDRGFSLGFRVAREPARSLRDKS